MNDIVVFTVSWACSITVDDKHSPRVSRTRMNWLRTSLQLHESNSSDLVIAFEELHHAVWTHCHNYPSRKCDV
jgi:hypothetical protein